LDWWCKSTKFAQKKSGKFHQIFDIKKLETKNQKKNKKKKSLAPHLKRKEK
jgi:hypothetical protein